MAEKVKVSREVADAIEFIKNGYDFEGALRVQLLKSWSTEHLKCLNDLSTEAFTTIMINGCEIEETPEEKLYSLWKCKLDEYNSITNFGKEFGGYSQDGFLKGIEATLDILGIKIEGINK